MATRTRMPSARVKSEAVERPQGPPPFFGRLASFLWLLDRWQRNMIASQAALVTFGCEVIDAAERGGRQGYALEWADSAFKNAARAEVLYEILAGAQRGAEMPQVVEGVRRYAESAARSPSRSTSPTHNLMAQEMLSERAQWLDDIRYYVSADEVVDDD